MTTTIYGHKVMMGEVYLGTTRRGATKINLLPMTVSQLKSSGKDGYSAIQVSFGKKTKKREIAYIEGLTVGTVINPPDVIQVGSVCTICATSKGKGFSGVVKRWGFAGGPRTHGQSDRLRAPGSIGQGTTPGRIHKGKKMAGHMGGRTVTGKGVLVVAYDAKDQSIWVTGPVPGSRNSLVRLDVTGHQEVA
ncbi:MAG: 50S ribosomal protein L3 [uncultured bacterium]|nr:MAG: 50S ribosomal protein L3 [uncultured bacterium]KKU15116.1 MAG: 50S ribosomal protein L3 [Microgenomates group bacterium GW2011_GWC2_45_8]KKU26322.1 MAG: 50S ribosomal protein L3 [Microgenomates group bacterium GW2011_GWA2_46_16]